MTVLRRVALAAILVMGISGVCQGEYEGLDEIHEVVFAVRALGGDGHWYANFGYWCSDSNRMMYGRDGGRLAALNLQTGRVRTILEAGDGAVRDPHIHYSGKKMTFSYRKSGSIYYHLYEINVDGTGLRQITGGEFDDIDIDVVLRSKWWAEGGKYREELKEYDPYNPSCPAEILEWQAREYAKLFALFSKNADSIQRITFWGLHDGQSWLNNFPWKRTNHPLLFDRNAEPKPAYNAVLKTK